MEKEKVGSFIAILRKSKSYTQQVLADKLGVSSKTVSKWECDEGLPDIMILPALAEILGVTIEELLTGKRLEQDNATTQTNNKSEIQLKLLVKQKESRFRNYSILSLGLTVLSLILGLLFLLSSHMGVFIFILGIITPIVAIIVQAININITLNSLDFSSESFKDINNLNVYKKHIKTTIFNWSYLIFALLLVCFCLIISFFC